MLIYRKHSENLLKQEKEPFCFIGVNRLKILIANKTLAICRSLQGKKQRKLGILHPSVLFSIQIIILQAMAFKGKRFFIALLALLLLIHLVDAQRGGGRGGGSRGGSWGGGRTSTYGGSNYYGNRSGGGSLGGGIIAMICAIPIACAACCVFIFTCGGRCCPNQDGGGAGAGGGQQYQYYDENQYKRPKTEYSPQDQMQFQRFSQTIVAAINSSMETPCFNYQQAGGRYPIKARVTNFRKVQPLLYDIQLFGEDELGPWRGRGVIVHHEQYGFKFRYAKIYDDRENAGQTGSFQHLIYESDYVNDRQVQGRWFYLGYENDPEYSGTWTIDNMNAPPNVSNNPFDNIANHLSSNQGGYGNANPGPFGNPSYQGGPFQPGPYQANPYQPNPYPEM